MKIETITENETLCIRRMMLDAGEPMYWHRDTCKRFTVVVQGTGLCIEFQGEDEAVEFPVHPGMAGWDEPDPRIHRAVNKGSGPYEEVVTFYKESPDVDPQPRSERL